MQPLTCACSIRQLIVTGTISGHLYTWDQEKRTILQSVKAHSSTINAMMARTTLKGDFFVTGGKDGVIKLWNLSMHCVKAFNMTEASVGLEEFCGWVVGLVVLVLLSSSLVWWWWWWW